MSRLERNAQEMRTLIAAIDRQLRMGDCLVAIDGPAAHMSVQEMRVVEHLADAGPRMMRELAEYLILAVNSVTSVVDNLEKKGQVQRVRSDQDRRVVRVELTPAGRTTAGLIVADKMRSLRAMFSNLTEDEQDIFILLMRKVARGGRDAPDRPA